jgi:peptide/nickel transport system substrate-binding protein
VQSADLPFAPSSPAYDAKRDGFYAFNLDKAGSLVADSGVATPTLDFNYSAVSREWAGIGQVYQADLAKIGVTLNLKPLDPVALNANSRARKFNGEMSGFIPLGQVSPTQQAFNPYFSPVLSFSGFKSDTLTQLAGALMHEVDPAKQKQVYADWSDYVLDQAWASTVATSAPLAAFIPRLHGLKYTLLEMLDYSEAWLDA